MGSRAIAVEEVFSGTGLRVFEEEALFLPRRGRALLAAGLSCGQGQLALLPRGSPARAAEGCSAFALLLGSAARDPDAPGALAEARALAAGGPLSGSLTAATARRMGDTARRLLREELRPLPRSGELAEAFAVELAVLALRALAPSAATTPGPGDGAAARRGPAPGERPWSIAEAIAYVDARYAERHSLEDFVARCATNPSDFSRRFKEAAGCPLFEYLNRQRVRRACLLLRDGDEPIIDVAYSVGYDSLSFFNRYFHRIMGMSPREYRAASRR